MATGEPADSLLGQLQRGTGLGFLRALQEDVAVVEPLLLDCVLHDPRWDRQLEYRSDYYAALITQFNLSLEPLEAYLRLCAEDDSDDDENSPYDSESLVLSTLCDLAIRGNRSALAIGRAYLTYGRDWKTVFETLIEIPGTPLSIDEMSRVIEQRFPADDMLSDELAFVATAPYTPQQSWQSLRRANARVDRILREHEQGVERRQQLATQRREQFAELSTAALLVEVVDHQSAIMAAPLMQKCATSSDLDLLLHLAQQGPTQQRIVALRGLQQLAHPASFPLLRAFFSSPEAEPGSLYGAAVRAICALPAEITLELARAWFDETRDPYHHVALNILEAHATAADVERVRNALLPSLERDTSSTNESYMQCGMLEILARFPQAGPYPEAEMIFQQAHYARARTRAAKVLVASERDAFAHSLALECLWDCEEDTRRIGCDTVDLTIADAVAKVQTLANDPHEEVVVHDAARTRLILWKSS